MTCPPALFSYTVSPNVVPCSSSSKDPTTVTLMLAINNPTVRNIDVAQIVFVLPIGNGNGDLTANPTVSTASAAGVDWTIDSDGQGNLTATPSPPTTGLEAGESIAFVVSGIEVNDLPGLAEITAYEQTGAVREALISVSKVPPGLAITSFIPSAVQVQPGSGCTLAWTSTGAASATLSHDGLSTTVATNGSTTVQPEVTTVYTLTVSGQGTSTYQQLTVYVPQVRILSFGASPDQVPMNGPSTLSWSVVNADTVYVEPGHVPVDPSSGTLVVTPAQTTTYELEATGFGDTVSMPATVNVPVVVESFTATPSQIPPNNPPAATLQWSIQGASVALITPDVGSVEASGTCNVQPLTTTTYTLNPVAPYPPQATTTVTVAPGITSLQLSIRSIGQGLIFWNVNGGDVTLAGVTSQPVPVLNSGASLLAPLPRYVQLTSQLGGNTVVSQIQLPSSPGGALIDYLTATCPYGINAPGATANLTWSASGGSLTGSIASGQTYPVSGATGSVDFVVGPASGQTLWTLDVAFGSASGQSMTWTTYILNPSLPAADEPTGANPT